MVSLKIMYDFNFFLYKRELSLHTPQQHYSWYSPAGKGHLYPYQLKQDLLHSLTQLSHQQVH